MVYNDDFEVFLIESAQDMIAMHPPSANPRGLPIEEFREEDGPFKVFNSDICTRCVQNKRLDGGQRKGARHWRRHW